MCFSQPKMPDVPPPPAPPPAPLPTAALAVTKRATQPTKRLRGTQQLTRVTRRRPSIGMGSSGGTGVQFSS